MLEIADRLLPQFRRGMQVAIATCIDVVGSAPHSAGTSMAVTRDGDVVGAVSGGCVEAAALADCRAVLAGRPAVVRRYGFGEAVAATAGLACGAEVDVLTCLIDPRAGSAGPLLDQLDKRLRGQPAAIGLVTSGPTGTLGAIAVHTATRPIGDAPASAVRAALEGVLRLGRPGGALVECAGAPLRLFVDAAGPAPRLLVIGATETAVALSAAAAAIGLTVTICDPRADFARPERFPAARAVLTDAPHRVVAAFAPTTADAVCLLSHDEDLDPLALATALESAAGYVGALGSRATADRRVRSLRALGVAESALARLHAPIGLDLGARTPAETAVSIVAELLAMRAGAAAASLRGGSGPLHRPAPLPT